MIQYTLKKKKKALTCFLTLGYGSLQLLMLLLTESSDVASVESARERRHELGKQLGVLVVQLDLVLTQYTLDALLPVWVGHVNGLRVGQKSGVRGCQHMKMIKKLSSL